MAFFTPEPISFATTPFFGSDAYVSGLNLTVTGLTTFTIGPGSARDLVTDYPIVFSNAIAGNPPAITVDISTTGLNGCFPVPLASLNLAFNTVFPVYIVANTEGTTSGNQNPSTYPAIIVATANEFLPKNMNAYRRIGFIYVSSGSGFIIPWSQTGNNNDRTYMLAEAVVVLAAGVAGVYTDVDLTASAGPVPPNTRSLVYINTSVTSAVPGDSVQFTTGNLSPATYTTISIVQTGAAPLPTMTTLLATPDEVTGHAEIRYRVTGGAAASLRVSGFVDNLGPSLF